MDVRATAPCYVKTSFGTLERIAAGTSPRLPAGELSPSGNKLKLDGYVIASIMPDWLDGVWKCDLPQLSGKLKLMPSPAWTPIEEHETQVISVDQIVVVVVARD